MPRSLPLHAGQPRARGPSCRAVPLLHQKEPKRYAMLELQTRQAEERPPPFHLVCRPAIHRHAALPTVAATPPQFRSAHAHASAARRTPSARHEQQPTEFPAGMKPYGAVCTQRAENNKIWCAQNRSVRGGGRGPVAAARHEPGAPPSADTLPASLRSSSPIHMSPRPTRASAPADEALQR